METNSVHRFLLTAVVAASGLVLASCGGGGTDQSDSASAHQLAAPLAVKPAALPRAPVEPLNVVGVPDVNHMGLLDGTDVRWTKVTNAGQRPQLRQLGKALFWDMQVGGNGVQSCASCHYSAGADNRTVNQISVGIKHSDKGADLVPLNGTLTTGHYGHLANGLPNRGLPVSQADRIRLGALADLPNGTPGALGSKSAGSIDLADAVSSQGLRAGTHLGVQADRVDVATLTSEDPDGFNVSFSSAATGIPNTVLRVEPRNSPTVIGAVFNLRNFDDGRADAFFNGVNPLGFRDPKAKVKAYTTAGLVSERLNIPLSSLASQAVGPIGNDLEMIFTGRTSQELGKKLTMPGFVPLRGQTVSAQDSVLGGSLVGSTSAKGLSFNYDTRIREVFDARFTGGLGQDVCLDATGALVGDPQARGGCTSAYTLLQWNFAMFFGLAVQAYEATLVPNDTIVDLIAGGKATGIVTNGTLSVNVVTMALDGCIASVALNTSAAQTAIATTLCTNHYAKFIHPGAISGTESLTAPFPVANGVAIGGCLTPAAAACVASPNQLAGARTLLNVNLGLGRFFSGNTACSVCHINPEFTGATVSTITGFGAQLPILPNGQLRKAIEPRALMERMVAFNGLPTVYDAGFYNLGVRPTGEDISLGDKINGVPLAMTKLFEIMNGGSSNGFDAGLIGTFAVPGTETIAASLSGLRLGLRIPTSPTNLTPMPFPFAVGCGPGVKGGVNANNNPVPQCVPTVTAGERLLRNGAFKTPSLRNVKFTGPHTHNGSKMNVRQVLDFYKTAGHFSTLNLNNLDAGMRLITIAPAEESALVELMETGLTDWRVAFQAGPFDHPEICIPNGHNSVTGVTRLVGIPAVGAGGSELRIPTFVERLSGAGGPFANNLTDACAVTGTGNTGVLPISVDGDSTIDLPNGVNLGLAFAL